MRQQHNAWKQHGSSWLHCSSQTGVQSVKYVLKTTRITEITHVEGPHCRGYIQLLALAQVNEMACGYVSAANRWSPSRPFRPNFHMGDQICNYSRPFWRPCYYLKLLLVGEGKNHLVLSAQATPWNSQSSRHSSKVKGHRTRISCPCPSTPDV